MDDRNRSLIAGGVLVVLIAGTAALLAGTHAGRHGIGLRCGELPRRTVDVVAELPEQRAERATYVFHRPNLTTADVERLARTLQIEGGVRETRTGWTTTGDYPTLTIDRVALGWVMDASIPESLGDEMIAARDQAGSRAAAAEVARELLNRIGVSTVGWTVSVDDEPDPAFPYRTALLAPVIEGRAFDGAAEPNWAVDVDRDGRPSAISGLLFELVAGPPVPLVPPALVARQFARLRVTSRSRRSDFHGSRKEGRRPRLKVFTFRRSMRLRVKGRSSADLRNRFH